MSQSKMPSNEAQTRADSILKSLAKNGPLANVIIHSSNWDLKGFDLFRKDKTRNFWWIGDAAASVVERDLNRDWAPETLLKEALAMMAQAGQDADPVLVFTISSIEHIESLITELDSSACAQYEKSPEMYEQLLAQALPPRFGELREFRLAEKNYRDGTHQTAALDWRFYLRAFPGPKAVRGLCTGLPSLDHALQGHSGLTLLGGLPGAGKTALALQFLAAALRSHSDLAGLYLLLDPGMSRNAMYNRLMSATAKLSYRTLIGPEYSDETKTKLIAASDELQKTILTRLQIIRRPRHSEDESQVVDGTFIANCANKLRRATGAQRMVVVVDYLGLIDAPSNMSPSSIDADDYRIRQIHEARDEDDVFLVIAEINKQAGDELSANDIKGSVGKLYGADRILLLEPSPKSDPTAPEIGVTLRIAKGRDGVIRTSIPLQFEHQCSSFREVAPTGARVKPDAMSPASPPRTSGLDPMAGIEEE